MTFLSSTTIFFNKNGISMTTLTGQVMDMVASGILIQGPITLDIFTCIS